MELKLKYNQHASHAIQAAFIRGNNPTAWLREMDTWKIELEPLVCFMLTQNNQPHHAAGLFVVFKKDQIPNALLVTQPYGILGDKLFIPVDAELLPQVSEQELRTLLIWDYQVFHPSLGFTGFEKTDRIAVADLLQYTDEKTVNWSYAKAGLPTWKRLQQIHIQQITAEEIFEALQQEINSKPISDIPKDNNSKDNALTSLLNKIGTAGLKGALLLTRGLTPPGSILSLIPGIGKLLRFLNMGNNAKHPSSGDNTPSQPGLLHKLTQWMEQKIQELEKQRDSELKRLSDLFDKNTDEALQYAIPLEGKYFNRGNANPSNQLSKRSTDFNLNKLGGGQAVDGWNVDNYYSELRDKYIKAAQKAIEENDHKKAAYVYAHLLGDYSSAARVLQQGKHYREAALLYKDHLNNTPMAAECLEQGGLLQEAIELYTHIDRHEKAGDLYTILDQKEEATACYEHCIEQAADNKDYLEQSRIITDKLSDQPRAKKVLLQGWNDVKQPEACLTKYFDLVAGDNPEHLPQEIQSFYTGNKTGSKKGSFLNVISKVNQQYATDSLNNTCKNIAYEIVSEQVTEGNEGSLFMLKEFVTDDQLLSTDCHRFIHTRQQQPKPKPVIKGFELMTNISWKIVQNWQSELLVWGTKPTGLHLARINQEGHIEYHTWNNSIGKFFLPVTDSDHTNRIILYASGGALGSKTLPANAHFSSELVIEYPMWIPGSMIAMAMIKNEVILLHSDKNVLFLNYYQQGGLQYSHRCTLNGAPYIMEANTRQREIICHNDHYYITYQNTVLCISKKGEVEEIPMNAHIEKIASTVIDDTLHLAVFTEHGCMIIYAKAGQWHLMGKSFAPETRGVTSMHFVSDKYIAIASHYNIELYELSETGPVLYSERATEAMVFAIFSTGARNQYGVLESNGKITLYDIKED